MDTSSPPWAASLIKISQNAKNSDLFYQYYDTDNGKDYYPKAALKELRKILADYSVDDFQNNPHWKEWKLEEGLDLWENANLLELAYEVNAPSTVMKGLIARGFSPNDYNEARHWTLMGKAVSAENLKMATLFINQGFDPSLILHQHLCQEGDWMAETSLLDRFLLKKRNAKENEKTQAILDLLWKAGQRPSSNLPNCVPIVDKLPAESWVRKDMLLRQALEQKQELHKDTQVKKMGVRRPRL